MRTRLLFIFLILSAYANLIFPQATKVIVATSSQDISFGAGLYMNTSQNSLIHTSIYTLDFAQFGYYNIGLRGGLSYIDDLIPNVSMFGMSLHFAWRSGIDRRTKKQRITSTVYSFITSGGDIASALINLTPFRLELNCGLTPMIATRKGKSCTYHYSNNDKYTEELSLKKTFALSADFGGRLSIRVWRINLFFQPEYRYWLADNFDYGFKSDKGYETADFSRSYLSLLLGLSFIL